MIDNYELFLKDFYCFIFFFFEGKEKFDGLKCFKIGGGFLLILFILGEEMYFCLVDGELNFCGVEEGIDIDGMKLIIY